jgi:glycosyltransferase involved in cell wall biosynthesis
LKVAIVMPHGKVAGAERVLCELLAETEPGTAVVCLPEGSPLAERVVALGHQVRDFRLPKLSGPASAVSFPWRYLRACRDLRAVVREENVTVLHSFVAFTIKAVAPVALLTRTPALLSVHEITTRAAIGGWRSRLQRWLAVAAFRRITAVSRYVAESLIAQGYPAERIVVVHNGIARSSAPAERAAARTSLGLPADALVVLVVGRLTRWKGQDVAIRAFARFSAGWRGADPRLAVVGGPFEPDDAAFETELHRSAAAGPLADRVTFFGQRQDTEVFYDAADVVLVPSLEPDPFPTVVLEAGLAGRCVVASDLGGAREAVVEGVTGLICPPTPEAFAGALARAADPEWRTHVESKARVHIEEEFSRPGFARAIHEQWTSTEAEGTRTRTPR